MKTFDDLLQSKTLNQLVQQAQFLEEIESLVNTVLEPEFRTNIRVASLKDNCLVLIVNNATWATRIRFATPQLLVNLNQIPELKEIKSIRCRVNPMPI